MQAREKNPLVYRGIIKILSTGLQRTTHMYRKREEEEHRKDIIMTKEGEFVFFFICLVEHVNNIIDDIPFVIRTRFYRR